MTTTPNPISIAPEDRPAIAARRGWQTLWQGLAITVGLAVLTTLVGSLAAPSLRDWLASWEVWTWSAIQAAGTALLAYLLRRYQDDSGVAPRHAADEDEGAA